MYKKKYKMYIRDDELRPNLSQQRDMKFYLRQRVGEKDTETRVNFFAIATDID